jgi:RimJ/RimL family protein N-acetyltransferase
MTIDVPVLSGRFVRLEPLELRHAEGLVSASATNSSLYRWSFVPRGEAEIAKYVETAVALKDSGVGFAFATVRPDGVIIGSTRFFQIEHWPWPAGHPLHGRESPDACEIGYTWLAESAVRTGANTEAKLLMLIHAFEVWGMQRVCFHTDVRNERSRAALERIGGRFEGILRSHRMATDYIARDSARYSILSCEWPEVKQRLAGRLNRS